MENPISLERVANPSSTAAAIAAGSAISAPRVNPDPHGMAYVVVPEGYSVEELPTRDAPDRPKALVKLRDVASFVRYYTDHKSGSSRVFATLEPARFLAVFDEFHAVADAGIAADWREFRAAFDVPASREWLLWNNANRKQMGQLAFAEFLQDNLPDVVRPDGVELLELALNFEATQSGTFVAAQRLQDGSHNLQWKQDNSGTTVRFPATIGLRIPVFENEPPRDLEARLRYRTKDGALTLWYELVRPHKVLEQAFREAWQRIETEAEAVILLGTPE